MEGMFKIVLETSMAASVLALLIMGARLIIGRRPSTVIPLLSALIIIRLMIPVMIPSPMSIMNLFGTPRIEQPSAEINIPQIGTTEVHGQVSQTSANVPQNSIPKNETDPVEDVPGSYIPAEITSADIDIHDMSALEIASIVWVAGMAVMAGCIAVSNMRFTLALRKNRSYDAAGFDELLESCKQEHRISQKIEAVQLSGINTAAVYGIFRSKLLISPSFGWLSEQEKRHVIMHELAHIKRRDMLASLLISILNTVHWFNPIIWAALALARRDMEIMCDMAVFKKTQDRHAYASTLLSLAKTGISKPRFVTALLELGPQNVMRFGASVSSDSIKRRIKMISRYKKSPLFTAVAIILITAIAVTGCTGAAAENTEGAVIPQTEKFSAPEIAGKELIASYSLDFNSIANDEARVANINKAAEMLDGKVFPHMDDYSSVNEDMKRQIDVPDILEPITAEAGWQNAAWTGWGSVNVYMHENDESSGYFADNAAQGSGSDDNVRMQVGGGIEIAAMAYYRAAALAGLDHGSGYTGGPEDMEAYLSGESKYTEPPQDNIDNGGVGAVNNEYVSDLVLKMWVQDNCVIAAFYAEGTAEQVPRATADPNDWRTKFADKFKEGAVETTENSYKGYDINISIEKVQKDNVTYYVADIYVAKLRYLRTAFPGDANIMGGREYTDVVAKANGALLAINGDFALDNPGPVVRNGKIQRDEKPSGDVLVMNFDGSMQTFSSEEFDTDIITAGVYQVWTCGPMLLHDGQPIADFNMPEGIENKSPRTAVGYFEPGHYCFVVVDGRQPGYSDGITLESLSQLMHDLGCTVAYNFDGGYSSEMVFMDKIINHTEQERRVADILYVGE